MTNSASIIDLRWRPEGSNVEIGEPCRPGNLHTESTAMMVGSRSPGFSSGLERDGLR